MVEARRLELKVQVQKEEEEQLLEHKMVGLVAASSHKAQGFGPEVKLPFSE